MSKNDVMFQFIFVDGVWVKGYRDFRMKDIDGKPSTFCAGLIVRPTVT